mgnify:CR=1 FL=1
MEAERKRFSEQKTCAETENVRGELLEDEDDNPFLQAWGRPGRENIRLLNQWSDWDYSACFVEKGGTANLNEAPDNQQSSIQNQLQKDILFREPRRIKSLEQSPSPLDPLPKEEDRREGGTK